MLSQVRGHFWLFGLHFCDHLDQLAIRIDDEGLLREKIWHRCPLSHRHVVSEASFFFIEDDNAW